jgi:uncharacterized membrane protein YeaQ/YmgE (transglycosylase-associated protein family)
MEMQPATSTIPATSGETFISSHVFSAPLADQSVAQRDQKERHMIGTIIGAIIAGLIIGALGRLILPGKQNISILMTIVIGIIASLVATLILGGIFGYTNASGGIKWWYWIVSAILAALGIVAYGRITKRAV